MNDERACAGPILLVAHGATRQETLGRRRSEAAWRRRSGKAERRASRPAHWSCAGAVPVRAVGSWRRPSRKNSGVRRWGTRGAQEGPPHHYRVQCAILDDMCNMPRA